jgi:serine/threonine protein kinase
MLEYFEDSVDIRRSNITPAIGEKILAALKCIHERGICHGDVNDFMTIRNVMLLPDDTVRWIDFELSECAEYGTLREGSLKEEWGLVQALVGSGGEMFKSSYVRCSSCGSTNTHYMCD